jgi:DNA invertase Pin-like site-specific DNA recombinase
MSDEGSVSAMRKGRIAAYCRSAVFNEEQVSVQEARLYAYARKQGYANADIICFCDNGASGTTLERPAFDDLTKRIQAGEIDTILTADISRIGREYPSVRGWLDMLDESGAQLITLSNDEVTLRDERAVSARLLDWMKVHPERLV